MNISEFAKVAGVSKSAVSRYFNDGYLSKDKREKIEAAIEKTGYSPSISARSVRTRITKLVGVILPKLSSESCARVTDGISSVLSEYGYELLLVTTSNNYHKEIESLELFRQNRVDGVILLSTVFTDLHRAVLSKMHVPVILVGQKHKGFNCVCHDDYGAARNLTKIMLEKGSVKPAYIGVDPQDKAAGEARYNGFVKAIEETGNTIRKEFMEIAEFTMDSGYEKARHLLSGKELPDSIFCATDTIALGVIMYCRDSGLRIPEDIMIASVGDSKVGRIAAVPITTAHLHYKTAGSEAAKMLLSAIKQPDLIPRVLQLDYYVIERQSTNKI